MTIPTVSPFTGEPWAEIPDGGAEDVDRAVRAARVAFRNPAWRRMAPIERGKLLRRLGDLIAQHADELALLETKDNGKLIREMSGHSTPSRTGTTTMPGWPTRSSARSSRP